MKSVAKFAMFGSLASHASHASVGGCVRKPDASRFASKFALVPASFALEGASQVYHLFPCYIANH